MEGQDLDWLFKFDSNWLFNVINNEPDIDKIYLYDSDEYEAKHQILINKQESRGLNRLNDSKAFIEYRNDIDDIYKSIKKYNAIKNVKYLLFLIIWLLICS